MKKGLSMLLSVILVLSAVIVPVNVVSAETEDYLKHYLFSFAEDDVYAYAPNTKNSATTMSFIPTGSDSAVTIAPFHESSSAGAWNSTTVAEFAKTDVGGVSTDSLYIRSSNDTQLVPIMENGKPFELAPGHTYTVKIEYLHKTAAEKDSWYSADMRGLYVCGGFTAPNLTNTIARSNATIPAFNNSYAHRPFYAKVDDLQNIDSSAVISKEVTLTTPAASGDGYTYDAAKNAYTTDITFASDGSKKSHDFYNYLYLHYEHYGVTEINVIHLEITRDDYVATNATVEYIDEDGSVIKTETAPIGNFPVRFTPENKADKAFLGWYIDEALTVPASSTVVLNENGLKLYAKWGENINWTAELENRYVFDFSDVDYYADVPNKAGQSVIDSNIDWTYAPITFNPGINRAERNVNPVYSVASTAGWGPQTWGQPANVEDGGNTYNTYRISTLNPSYFIPLKDDGTPFELAPGHKYSIRLKYYVTSYVSGSPMLQCDVGVPSNGNFVQNTQTTLNDTSIISTRIGWLYNDVGKISEKTFTITMPDITAENYDILNNTYKKTVGGIEYTLYSYLYFSLTNYGKPVIDIVSLEITRDDYIVKGTVEYFDNDGSVLKSEEVVAGEYAINFIPQNKADMYFAGWYLDENLTSEVTSAKLSMTDEGLKLYSKWMPYTESIVSSDPTYYYGSAACPSLTADGVYSKLMSTRSNTSSTAHSSANGILTMSTAFWGDGILLTAVDDETGELFRAKPNTTYKITVKFRITAETTRSDGIDVNMAAGAGLPDTDSNYPMGKYWDENSLKSKGKFTSYTDGTTAEGKFLTYAAVYTTGDFTTIPAIGVEMWLYQGAAVEIYSLSVSEFDGESVAEGEFLVTKEAKNNTTYMVNFDYALLSTPSNNIGIGFKTTASDTIGYPTFIEGENIAIYTVKSDAQIDKWYTATVLLTTDMMANVVNSFGYDDVSTALNTNLYGYIIGDEASLLSVKNVKFSELSDSSGNDLIAALGGQCLTDEAEAVVGSQALRYSYSYDTKTGNEIIINGKEYSVKERGFIYVNGNNYAKNGVYMGNFNLTNAKNGNFIYNSKKYNLDVCWKHSSIENTDYSNLVFSTYVKDFELNDTKEMMIKAFVVIEIDGQLFTVYSDSVNRSVAYLKSLI